MRAARAERGAGDGGRPRRRARPRRCAHVGRLHVAEVLALPRPLRAGEPGLLRRSLPHPQASPARARESAARRSWALAERPSARRRAPGRDAPAARPRDVAHPRTLDRVPGRADRRRGPRGATQLLAHHSQARGVRDDRLRDDSLHGRGRVLRARRDDGRRQARRPRHPERPQALVRAWPHLRAARPAAASGGDIGAPLGAGRGAVRRRAPRALRRRRPGGVALEAAARAGGAQDPSAEEISATLEDVFLAVAGRVAA